MKTESPENRKSSRNEYSEDIFTTLIPDNMICIVMAYILM
jgi:hypothetical protein